MSDYVHPFESGIRVMLVKLAPGEKPLPGKSEFAVAVSGYPRVVALPTGYDGETSVYWVDGWIIARHPEHDSLLVDMVTETLSPMNEHAAAAAMRAYEAPHITH